MSERMIQYALIAVVAAILLVSQFILKLGVQGSEIALNSPRDFVALIRRVLTSPNLLFGYALSGVAALVWLVVLSRTEISFAFPLLNSIYFLLLMVASSLILQEDVTMWRWIGTLLIVVGMFALAQDPS